MNTNSIFYPHFFRYLIVRYVMATLNTGAFDYPMIILCTFLSPLILWYYILDVLDNAFDRFTMWLFVDLQLWAIQEKDKKTS